MARSSGAVGEGVGDGDGGLSVVMFVVAIHFFVAGVNVQILWSRKAFMCLSLSGSSYPTLSFQNHLVLPRTAVLRSTI